MIKSFKRVFSFFVISAICCLCFNEVSAEPDPVPVKVKTGEATTDVSASGIAETPAVSSSTSAISPASQSIDLTQTASEPEKITDTNIDQVEKTPASADMFVLLNKAFTKTFGSAREFKDCNLFRILGYDIAETDLLRRITPKPVSLSVDYMPDYEKEGLSENEMAFSYIEVECYRVHYFNVILEKVSFRFPNCVIDYKALKEGNLRFLKTEEVGLGVSVSEHDILGILQLYEQARLISDVKVFLGANSIRATGSCRYLFLRMKFDLTGAPCLVSSKVMKFRPTSLKLNGLPYPLNVANYALNRVNPIFDSRGLWLNIEIDEVKIIDGLVVTKGSIKKKKVEGE